MREKLKRIELGKALLLFLLAVGLFLVVDLGFFLSVVLVTVGPLDLTSLICTGASAAFSAAGRAVLVGPTAFMPAEPSLERHP